MSSDRPFYFFELSGESEVVLGWKILFGTIYRNTWGMDFPPQNEIWTRNSPFFSSQAGIQRLFLDVQSLTGLYTDIRSERIGDPKTGYESRPTSVFFRVRLGYRGRFWMFNHWLDCIQTYVQEGLGTQRRDMSSDRPFYFFELSGKSEVVLWGGKNSVPNCI